MTTMASQITSLTIVYSTVYLGADQRKHQSSATLAFVRGIYRWPVNFPHNGPVTQKMFQLMTSSCDVTHVITSCILGVNIPCVQDTRLHMCPPFNSHDSLTPMHRLIKADTLSNYTSIHKLTPFAMLVPYIYGTRTRAHFYLCLSGSQPNEKTVHM